MKPYRIWIVWNEGDVQHSTYADLMTSAWPPPPMAPYPKPDKGMEGLRRVSLLDVDAWLSTIDAKDHRAWLLDTLKPGCRIYVKEGA